MSEAANVPHLKETEAALRESELRLRLALEAAQMGTFEADIAGGRLIIGAQEAHIFGLPAETRLVSTDELRARIRFEDLQACDVKAENGGAYHHEFRLRMPDGAEHWLSAYAEIDEKHKLTDRGEPSRKIGVVADITERKALEQEAAELSERLVNLQEEERQRIAQELHDSTAQHLVAVNLNLMSLRPKAGLESDEVKLWDEVEASMAEALKEIRTLSYLMHPPRLDTDGLCSTIRRYIEGYTNRSGLSVKLKSSPNVDKLPLDMQRSLFRIVQEALTNVHRHASASRVSVDLRWIVGRLHVIVTDNGRGAEGKQEPPSFRPGVGIYSIRARARQFGGDLKIRTGPHGTRIHVVAPVERARRIKSSSPARRRKKSGYARQGLIAASLALLRGREKD
jgi:signal transduction histidine kinase